MAVHDSGGKRFPVLNLRRVVHSYLRTWFLIDFVAAVPFDRFASTSQSDRSPVVRLPGLIKIVRLLKLKRTIRKWNGLSYGPLLKVITIVFGWLLVAHWFACALLLDCPTSRHCTQASDEHASYGCASDGWVGER